MFVSWRLMLTRNICHINKLFGWYVVAIVFKASVELGLNAFTQSYQWGQQRLMYYYTYISLSCPHVCKDTMEWWMWMSVMGTNKYWGIYTKMLGRHWNTFFWWIFKLDYLALILASHIYYLTIVNRLVEQTMNFLVRGLEMKTVSPYDTNHMPSW